MMNESLYQEYTQKEDTSLHHSDRKKAQQKEFGRKLNQTKLLFNEEEQSYDGMLMQEGLISTIKSLSDLSLKKDKNFLLKGITIYVDKTNQFLSAS